MLTDRHIARQMGVREWQRITWMAGAAEKDQWSELTLAVCEASQEPDRHENHLREQYEELKQRIQP